MKERPFLLLGFLLALSPVMAESTYPVIPPEIVSNDVKFSVQTPHTEWAKPYAGGKLEILFIGPRFAQRETVEVAQRFPIEATTVLTGLVHQWDWGYPIYVSGSSEAELLAELDQKLSRPYDLIVLGNIDWGLLPKSATLKIFRQVARGAGLIFCQFGEKRFPPEYLPLLKPEAAGFASLIPLAAFEGLADAGGKPILEALPAVECFRFRKGRVTLFDYPGAPNRGFHYLTSDPNSPAAYDYEQALLGKAFLWASGKAVNDFSITAIKAPEVVRGLGEIAVTIADSRPSPQKLECSVTIRDRNGAIVLERRSAREGRLDNGARFKIEPLPEGVYFADVTFRRAGGEVVDWASTTFRVLGEQKIQEIVLFEDTLAPDQEIKGRVVTTRPLAEEEKMRVSLIDQWKRTFARFDLPDEKFIDVFPVRNPATLGFRWPVADTLSTINTIRAEWFSGGRLISVAERAFSVPRRKDSDFFVGVWSSTERTDRAGWLFTALSSRERALGVDAALLGHIYMNPAKGIHDALALARAGLSPFPYIERTAYYGTSRERTPCLSDPKFLSEKAGELRSWAWELRRAGCIGYNLGDEANLSILGIDVCTAPATLAAFRLWLKEQYGSLEALNAEYGSAFQSWDEIVPPTRKEAAANKNQAPWLDHMVFMAKVMADYIGSMQAALRQSDPLARAGCEGIWGTSPHHGFEWTQQAAKAGVMIPYANELLSIESVRSFQKPGTLTGIWTGGYPQHAMFEWKERYYPWYALLHGMNSVWFYDDYNGTTESLPMSMLSHDYTLNRAGRWFLEETEAIKFGIGKLILHAQRRNDPIALLYSEASAFLAGNHADDWIAALEDAGYQYDVIARGRLESAEGLGGFKVLILPHTVSLSDAEAGQIRKFVEQGGTVMADILPGEFDGHGKKRVKSPLEDLFTIPNDRVQRLEFSLEKYGAARDAGKKRDIPSRLGALLERAGLPKRQAAPGLERVTYTIPGGEIHAALLRGTGQKDGAVTIPAPTGPASHAVDLLTGREFKGTALVPGRPAVWAQLKHKPGRLAAKANPEGQKNRFTLSLEQPDCAFDVVHLTVSDPEGKRVDGYTQNLVLRDGRLEVEIYLGETAAPGRWTVAARTVIGAQETDVKLEVQARQESL